MLTRLQIRRTDHSGRTSGHRRAGARLCAMDLHLGQLHPAAYGQSDYCVYLGGLALCPKFLGEAGQPPQA